jgi:hypothetical protein
MGFPANSQQPKIDDDGSRGSSSCQRCEMMMTATIRDNPRSLLEETARRSTTTTTTSGC